MDSYLSLFLFLFLISLFVEEMRGSPSQDDQCMTSSNGCGQEGVVIQFPFRLKHQPYHCGYPGFELSCSENNQTMLELPDSVKFLVKNIFYKSQEIIVQDPDDCLARQLANLSLAASPFRLKSKQDFTFFNCSSDNTKSLSYFESIPCLSIHGNPVYAVYSSYPVRYLDLTSCRRLYNASVPYDDGGNYIFNGSAFSLKWSKSICGSCHGGGKLCRLKINKNNSMEPQIECVKGKGIL